MDKLLIDYKTEVDKDTRYLIKASVNDIEILIQSTRENRQGPYRRIDPGVLGAIPELNLKTEKAPEVQASDDSEFSPVNQSRGSLLG